MTDINTVLAALLGTDHERVLQEWVAQVAPAGSSVRGGPASSAGQQTRAEAHAVLQTMQEGLAADGDVGLESAAWDPLRGVLAQASESGAARGATAAETSNFVLALKRPLFSTLQTRLRDEPTRLTEVIWAVSTLVDNMALLTMTTYQRSREEIIRRQQLELLELSTPVVKLWDGVLAVPMIGTLDSSRTQLVMESLLTRIVETGSEIAIIDITGVPTVDTLVAQHLLKTVTAIRLMGADCIISGVRPQIAQTIVHLGIDLQGITTKASLSDALALAMKRGGYVVTRTAR